MTPRAKEPEMLLRINVVARRLGISRRTIYYMIYDGRLRAVRLGTRCLRIRSSEIDAFLRRNTLAPAAAEPIPGRPLRGQAPPPPQASDQVTGATN